MSPDQSGDTRNSEALSSKPPGSGRGKLLWIAVVGALLTAIAIIQNTGAGRSAAQSASETLSQPLVDLQLAVLLSEPATPLNGELKMSDTLSTLAQRLQADLPPAASLTPDDALSLSGSAVRLRLLGSLYHTDYKLADQILKKAQKAKAVTRDLSRIIKITLTDIDSWTVADDRFIAQQRLGPLGLLASARALADRGSMVEAEEVRSRLIRMGQIARAKSEFSSIVTLFLFFAGSTAWLIYLSAGKARNQTALKSLRSSSLPLWQAAAAFLILFLALAVVLSLAADHVGKHSVDDETLSLVHYVLSALVAVPGAAILLRAHGLSLKSLGLVTPDWVFDIAWGIGGFFAAAILSIVLGMVMIPVSRALGSQGVTNPASRYLLMSQAGWMTAALMAVFGIVAPFVEELFFRGALLRALNADFGQQAAIWGSAVAFAIIHPGAPELLVTYVALGWVFAKLTVLRGSLLPSMIAHALNNLLTASLLLLLQV